MPIVVVNVLLPKSVSQVFPRCTEPPLGGKHFFGISHGPECQTQISDAVVVRAWRES